MNAELKYECTWKLNGAAQLVSLYLAGDKQSQVGPNLPFVSRSLNDCLAQLGDGETYPVGVKSWFGADHWSEVEGERDYSKATIETLLRQMAEVVSLMNSHFER